MDLIKSKIEHNLDLIGSSFIKLSIFMIFLPPFAFNFPCTAFRVCTYHRDKYFPLSVETKITNILITYIYCYNLTKSTYLKK